MLKVVYDRLEYVAAGAVTLFFLLNRYAHLPAMHRSVYALFAVLFAAGIGLTVFRVVRDCKRDPENFAKYFFIVAVITVPFWFVATADYWPHNHEDLSWKNRLVMYTMHFYQGDFTPYWS